MPFREWWEQQAEKYSNNLMMRQMSIVIELLPIQLLSIRPRFIVVPSSSTTLEEIDLILQPYAFFRASRFWFWMNPTNDEAGYTSVRPTFTYK